MPRSASSIIGLTPHRQTFIDEQMTTLRARHHLLGLLLSAYEFARRDVSSDGAHRRLRERRAGTLALKRPHHRQRQRFGDFIIISHGG